MDYHHFRISGSRVPYYFNAAFRNLATIADRKHSIIISDEKVADLYASRFKPWKLITIPAGEQYKNLETVQYIVERLIEMEADRKTLLIGVGGGVVTDITGFVASIYMRGVPFGLVPTTLLNMVDASVGGKNGIDWGLYKNLLGRIEQPAFIFQDVSFLKSLPLPEWENGFAEIIKHACIKNRQLFLELEKCSIASYQKDIDALAALLYRNVRIKLQVVQKDVYENGERKLLNFGHTIGHALENKYQLSHGRAVAIGMALAAQLSEKISGFKDKERVTSLIEQYQLPVQIPFDSTAVFDILKMDKKRVRSDIHFVLLDKIGQAAIQPVSLEALEQSLKEFSTAI